jgi:cytochrome P450 family 2 subfamily J
MLSVLIILTATLAAYWVLVKPFKHPKGFPPGPRMTLPFIGDALAVKGNNVLGFRRLRKIYGDIFGGWLGNSRFVVVNNMELIQEAGSQETLIARPFVEFMSSERGSLSPKDPNNFPGVLYSSGQTWRDLRRFSLSTLRDLGFGKNSTENMVTDEAIDLCKRFEQLRGEPRNIRNDFNISVLNTLWRIISGERLAPESPKIQRLVKLVDDFLSRMGRPSFFLLATRPFLSKVALKLAPSLGIGTTFAELTSFTHQETIEMSNNVAEDAQHTYMESHLHEIKKHTERAASGENGQSASRAFLGKEGEINLVNVLVDFFIAGSDTTSTTLNWAMLFMALHPQIQEKVQRELDSVAGSGHAPPVSQRNKTPYVEAVLLEVQRLGNIVPFGVHHFAAADTKLGGYDIPAGTIVFCNLDGVMSDPVHFPQPEKFNPDRFLSDDGSFVPNPKVIPFGLGRRRCLGESLARMSLYTFFTNILAKFTVKPENPNELPSTDPMYGLVASPRPYKVKFIPRH